MSQRGALNSKARGVLISLNKTPYGDGVKLGKDLSHDSRIGPVILLYLPYWQGFGWSSAVRGWPEGLRRHSTTHSSIRIRNLGDHGESSPRRVGTQDLLAVGHQGWTSSAPTHKTKPRDKANPEFPSECESVVSNTLCNTNTFEQKARWLEVCKVT